MVCIRRVYELNICSIDFGRIKQMHFIHVFKNREKINPVNEWDFKQLRYIPSN